MKRLSRTHRCQLESLESRRLLTTYTVDLGTLGGATSSASDINASGQVVGTSVRADWSERAFIWQNGVMTDLGTLGGGYSRAFGLNDLGQVVGQSGTSTQPGRAFLVTPEDTDSDGKPDRWYRDTNGDGKNDLMLDLGTIGGNYVYAVANEVNNLGQVVGRVSTDGFHGSVSHAFRWQSGVMTDMGTFGGQQSYATAINDAGQITGWSSSGLFLWKAGVVTHLGLSNGGIDINGAGQLIDDSRIWTPTVLNGSSGTFTTLGQLPSVWPEYPDYVVTETLAQSINAAGQVVGTQAETFYGENANGYYSRGIRWINGVPEELPLEFASAINDTGQIVGGRGERALLLTDDLLALPLLTISGATVTEGHSGTTNADFTVTLSHASAQTVTVHYATSDGSPNHYPAATAGEDYLAISGTLTFTPGQINKTISVQVLGDRSPEYVGDWQTENFSMALSSPDNAIVAGTAATGGIRDDEPLISSEGPTVLEGNSGSTTALLTANLSIAYDQPVTLIYATIDQTALAGSDYVATSGTVTFAPGETTRQIAVSILGDHIPESLDENGYLHDFEYIGFTASNPSGNATLYGLGAVRIQDDEPRVTISPYVEVTEPATGTIDALITVSLSAAYDQDVMVEYETQNGTALAGSDYVATVGSVTIPAGKTSRTITVPIIGDGLVEDGEVFYVHLSGVSGNAVIPYDDGYGGWSEVGIRDYDGTVKTWIGPASGGNWSTAANWSPSGMPTASDHVSIVGKSVNLASSAVVASLTLTGGATLNVGAAGNCVLRTSSLTITGSGSTLNLADNDLIVDYSGVSPVGVWSGSAYEGVAGMIESGRITSSLASGNLKTLGVAEARDALGITGSQTATFAGQAVDSTAVLVKPTWRGDANLDGKINIDDYGRIDGNVSQSGSVFGWFNGDFNLDGKINIDDYGIIDGNISQQDEVL